jgi:hypothetical protein
MPTVINFLHKLENYGLDTSTWKVRTVEDLIDRLAIYLQQKNEGKKQ